VASGQPGVRAPRSASHVSIERTSARGSSPIQFTPRPLLADRTQRQISPQIAAALLAKPRPEFTGRQAQIVDALKAGCPVYTIMRKLMLSFRSILKQPIIGPAKTTKRARTTAALHHWLERAHATGIASIQTFLC
jgi:hypothetical protein